MNKCDGAAGQWNWWKQVYATEDTTCLDFAVDGVECYYLLWSNPRNKQTNSHAIDLETSICPQQLTHTHIYTYETF